MRKREELEPYHEEMASYIKAYSIKNELTPSEILFIISLCTTDLAYAFNEAFRASRSLHSDFTDKKRDS